MVIWWPRPKDALGPHHSHGWGGLYSEWSALSPRTDPPPPDCALAGLLYHWASQGRWKQQVVAHLPDKVVCIRPLLLYLYTSQVIGLSSHKVTS